ncbi:hypothetical protein RRSWK_06056 [Rhodopirellula sp. SWK7]|nr:hypothetical protein RRSWK_06056 [Rhodopirellula sp. SWK7]
MSFFLIACGHSFTDTTNSRPHVAADATVSKTANFILAKSFFGALGIWHVIGGGGCHPDGD